MGKTVLDLYKGKIIFFKFQFIFSFKKTQRIRSPLSQASKKLKKKNFVLILGKQPKFSKALRARKEATLRREILELGSKNNLAQHLRWSIFFFFKITPPYPTPVEPFYKRVEKYSLK